MSGQRPSWRRFFWPTVQLPALLVAMATYVSCVTAASTPATESPARTPKAVAAPALLSHPFLWSFAKDGRVNYLLGTVHVGVDAQRELPPRVWEAFSSATCFVMEADQSQIDSQAVLKLAQLAPGEPTLEEELTPKAWALLTRALKGSFPPSTLRRVKPWFATIVYMQQHVQQALGDVLAMDLVLHGRAKATGKRLAYLETWTEALNAFARATTSEDLADLLLDPEGADLEAENLVKAYRSGDAAAMAQTVMAINAATKNAAAKNAALLDGRNELWLPRLMHATAAGGCFVAVGAGHLLGPRNLRDRLVERGYSVRRIGRTGGQNADHG